MLVLNQIHQGHVLDLLSQLALNSINCVVTSPPYFNQRNYPGGVVDWPEISYAPMVGLPPIEIPGLPVALGREKTIEAYIGHLVLVFRMLGGPLRDDGVLWLNIGDKYAGDSKWGGSSGGKNDHSLNGGYQSIRDDPVKTGLPGKNLCGIPWRLALALQADDWILRADVIWDKTNGNVESVRDRPTKSHEYLFLFSKSPRYWYDAEAIKRPIKQSSLDRLGSGLSDGHKSINGIPGQHKQSHHKSRKPVKSGGNKAEGHGTRLLSGNEWQPESETANRRSVWQMATSQFPGSHFAVMPEEMARLCLLAGCPEQICSECGKPYKRVIKPTGNTNNREPAHVPNADPTKTDSTSWRPTTKATNTFEPTCSCDALSNPGVILDPFMGAGTVAKTAIENNRDWLGFELNPEYIELAYERIGQVQRGLPGIGGVG